jgi:hypothetical protein
MNNTDAMPDPFGGQGMIIHLSGSDGAPGFPPEMAAAFAEDMHIRIHHEGATLAQATYDMGLSTEFVDWLITEGLLTLPDAG